MNGGADLNEIINKLTENPETMRTLMNAANGLFGGGGNEPGKECGGAMPRKESGGAVSCREECGETGPERECRTCENGGGKKGDDAENLIRLLHALKPYVSGARRDKIDSIVKILKLIQLSEKSGLLKSLM